MKIYTKTGDSGETGLFGGPRVRKDDVRIEAYGTVDELNAVLGVVLCEELPAAIRETLTRVQHELFSVGAELATPDPTKFGTAFASEAPTLALEAAIDQFDEQLPPLKQFILPGGSRGACQLHNARGVCRRAERCVVTFETSTSGADAQGVIRYLNRLSDYLFVAARFANFAAGVEDVPWVKA